MTETIRYAVEDGLATMTLARPQAGNAMSGAFIDEFAALCEGAASDAAVRAMLIVAEGKNFCVGGDINAFANATDAGDLIQRMAARLGDGIRALMTMDAPVVIAVRGAAAGAGLSLAMAGDIVLAGEGANFTMAYTTIGLTGDGGATWTLPRLVGVRRAQEMALLNRRVSASEALEFGMVTRVAADEAVEAEALEIARRLATGPTRALAGVKRFLNRSFDTTLEDHLDAEATSMAAAMRTNDAQGAIRSFLAKEKPVYRGE